MSETIATLRGCKYSAQSEKRSYHLSLTTQHLGFIRTQDRAHPKPADA
jgi:hypothetical protein